MLELSPQQLLIALSTLGFLFGFLASVFGNSLPLNLAIMQIILPQASFGVLVGTAKVGGIFRGTGMLIAVYKKINLKMIAWIWPSIAIGSVIGVSLIAHLEAKWIFPTLVVAYLIAEFSSKIANKISNKTLYQIAVLTGIYIGFLGAGMRAILMSFMRLKFPEDDKITLLKIHCSLTAWSTAFIAAIGHYYHGNIVWEYVLPFAGGCFFGGLIGGQVLKKFTLKSAKSQKWLTRASFGLGIIVSGYLFFQS